MSEEKRAPAEWVELPEKDSREGSEVPVEMVHRELPLQAVEVMEEMGEPVVAAAAAVVVTAMLHGVMAQPSSPTTLQYWGDWQDQVPPVE